MTGPGTVPSPASQQRVAALRVLFVLIALLTCGIGAWAPMLRIAVLRRRALDWVLTAVVAALAVTGFALTGGTPEESVWSDVGVATILGLAVLTTVYYLAMDIRIHSAPRPGPVPGPAPGPHPGPLPGQPQPVPLPYAQPQPPLQPQTPLQAQPLGYNPYQDTPPPAPAPAPRPTAPRIEQVRAELDELSDYLRKQEGGR
ncbi:hypothetical protein GCM10027168_33700 [Streptomyces capparidis]